MGIGSTAGIAATTGLTVRHVEARRTAVSTTDLRGAIGRAYAKVTGQTASPALLDTLTAQASLETGRGGAMFNYNFGGIKGHSASGDSADCMTHEVEGGHDIKIRQGFRAYNSLDEGAEDYVKVLQKRFGGALAVAQTGNVDGFAHALKQEGYYTASEADYAKALRSFSPSGTGATGSSALASSTGGVNALSPSTASASLPTATDIERMLDALNVSALRIAAPDGDET